jgi:hypothetical protein
MADCLMGSPLSEFLDLETSLLDRDGSCRDLNFEAPTWSGVMDLVASLEKSYHSMSATDSDGHAIPDPLPVSVVTAAKSGGYVHGMFNGGPPPIKNLQAFIAQNEDGSPFVELTFFPEDVEPGQSLRLDFIAWADSLRILTQARRYCVRYENASWQFGDTGPRSGVFLVSEPEGDDA